ncbi:23S rRNA (pseudouridine(1915)-N(3))-methyltransferase RlmH [Acholeplasma hippikon]|uniref:Ribosomal RNA large subunit methyltransferase H n=1 Tax=Acholeplasma hippikon TaxID=264636 RepID=A0A449BKC3_9MOLU|nr:23S rRNA (pseudouridine(1915)-N(3))-methyltransferase RlmH [Acholeplasma hippikon]VEU82880.1 Ribosomal RNA large subunit methyltransferase H [Acholeplasma hippikon]
MKIKVIGVGKIKQKELLSLIDDYTKQIKDISIIEIPDEKDSNGMEKEGKQILSKLDNEDYVIALAIEGKQLDSVGFSELLDKVQTFHSSSIAFIIGGSYGLSDQVKQRANFLLSFSKMTFPHQLMRLMLVEQIYRALAILKNHPYHK